MAFNAANFVLMGVHGNGFKSYRYDTTDTVATVDGAGYINNTDDMQNLVVGDFVWVVEWASAVRTGTVADVSLHVVTNIVSGAVNLSNDLLGATVASGD